MKSSANCGLCMECLRVCPRDNIAVNLRSWGSDLGPATKHRLDETFLGLVMLASVLVDAAVFLGPWGMLKTAAYTVGSVSWRVYAGLFLAAALVFLPAVFAAAVWLSRRLGKGEGSFQSALAMYGQALVPLGMMAWIAFTVSFALSKFSCGLPVLFEPFGWGWHLPGAVAVSGVGGVSALSLVSQVSVLAVGLSWSSRVARRVASSLRAAVPVIGFTGMLCLGMLWLLVG